MKSLHPVLAAASLVLAACSPQPEATPSVAAAPEAEPAASALPTVSPTASATMEQALRIPANLRALGTEPFWSAKIANGRMIYSTPESPDGATFPVSRKPAGDGVVFTGVIDGKPIELEVSAARCSDGMSDTIYPFAVVRRIGPDIQRGCAR